VGVSLLSYNSLPYTLLEIECLVAATSRWRIVGYYDLERTHAPFRRLGDWPKALLGASLH
jgi:hypothetical protein